MDRQSKYVREADAVDRVRGYDSTAMQQCRRSENNIFGGREATPTTKSRDDKALTGGTRFADDDGR